MTSYLTVEDVVSFHKVLIQRYGGAEGIKDLGALDSALHRPQSGYYDDVLWQAAAMFESLLMNHAFVDGNKRTAFAALHTFLLINGYELQQSWGSVYKSIVELFQWDDKATRIAQIHKTIFRWLHTDMPGVAIPVRD